MGDAVQTIPRRLLGGELRRLRQTAGRTLDETSAAIGKDRSQLIKLEDGRANLTAAVLEQLLLFLGAKAGDRKRLLAMGVEARKRQPKRAYVDLLPGANTRIADLESDATTILYYGRGVIPGLLQIPEYTEAQMLAGDGIWWETSYQERVNRVAFRLERQKLPATKEHLFIFTDDALTTRYGDSEVMRRQVEHLLRAGEQPNIRLRLLDATSPANPCPTGEMILFEFDGRTPRVGLLPVAYGPSTYLDEPSDTEAIARCFQRLQELAFSEEESRARLEAALEAP
ncbi:helix-turn-helix domain-containing protein [Saccharothrix algeriensis]|uniref:Transcriptional regulator with XRE-family HTH domain n=1 Tax=Saccharothrix algeriensis TaxID=173560 RepID=A0ABS2SBR5_9PSEU|nr:Scr1 family TA system antitoxin-like transcriptional regulator [Saccharothrix algeriensis]MBM7813074.1 transcriptional regulator with XRE-family HTH domain [Saccharothrix algeriensis]